MATERVSFREGGAAGAAAIAAVDSENRRALDRALGLHSMRMAEASGQQQVDHRALEAVHNTALKEAEEAFDTQARGSAAEKEVFLRELREKTASMAHSMCVSKRAELKARSDKQLEVACNSFAESISAEEGGGDLTAAVSQLHGRLHAYGMDVSLGQDRFMWAAESLAGRVVHDLVALVRAGRERLATEEKAHSRLKDLQKRDGEHSRHNQAVAMVADVVRRQQLQMAEQGMAALGKRLAEESAKLAEESAAATARDALAAAEKEVHVLRKRLAVVAADRGLNAERMVERHQADLAAVKEELREAVLAAKVAKVVQGTAVHALEKLRAELATKTAEAEAALREADQAKVALAEAQCTLVTLQRSGASSPLPSADEVRVQPQTPPLGDATIGVRRSGRPAAAVRRAAATTASPAAAAASPASGRGCGPAAATRAATAAAATAATTTAAARGSGRCRVLAAAAVPLETSMPPLEVVAVKGKRGRTTVESDCEAGVETVGTAAEQRASQRPRIVVEGIL
ncbi:hypothetical protein Vafri_12192 [Volvox africanus]|uniref:Uncharacterized protein n=1 Tax=Volvox africanus TaxID=51714 RepID=A0A8J4B9R1_9CHLO|nr:hypothetical protein Vafri_12192 [Volvox africanus]